MTPGTGKSSATAAQRCSPVRIKHRNFARFLITADNPTGHDCNKVYRCCTDDDCCKEMEEKCTQYHSSSCCATIYNACRSAVKNPTRGPFYGSFPGSKTWAKCNNTKPDTQPGTEPGGSRTKSDDSLTPWLVGAGIVLWLLLTKGAAGVPI